MIQSGPAARPLRPHVQVPLPPKTFQAMIATMRIAMTEIVQPAALTAATTIGVWVVRGHLLAGTSPHHRLAPSPSDADTGDPA
jgi:hypothetical protein